MAVDDMRQAQRRPPAPAASRRPTATPTPSISARRAEQLHAAPAEDRPAQRPQPARLQLQPDQEQHQHHAELGEVQHRRCGSVTSLSPQGPMAMPAAR